MEIKFIIPTGAEKRVKEIVAMEVERFLLEQFRETPAEEKLEYQQAVDSFRAENKMSTKFGSTK